MFSEFNSWLFYLGAFGFSAYTLGFIKENQKKVTSFYVAVTCIALAIPILMAAYRSCGTDTLEYMATYIRLSTKTWDYVRNGITSIFESGHQYLTRFLGIFHSVRVYFGFYAAVTLLCVFVATNRYKGSAIALPMFIYYFLFFVSSFNGMRQSFAAAIVAFSFQYIFKRDFVKYALVIGLAVLFHTSALIMIFVYFLWRREEKLLPWPLLLAIMVSFTIISLSLDTILNSFAGYEFESASLNRYVGYTSNELETKNRDFYLNLFVALVIAWHYTRLVKVDKRNAFFAFLFYLGTILGLCGFISPAAKRIGLYFKLPQIWILADIPKCYKDHHSVWTARLLIIFYAVMRFTLTAYILEQSHLIPYMWVLPSWAR